MKKIIMHIVSLALVALMAVPVFGCVMASAASEETATTNKVIYFEDTKNWGKAFAYTWEVEEVEGADGQITEVAVAKTAFPGTEMRMVGKVYRDGEYRNVFSCVIDEDADFIIFSQGFEHGQQSAAVNLTENNWGGNLIVSLDVNNNALVGHFFEPSMLLPC